MSRESVWNRGIFGSGSSSMFFKGENTKGHVLHWKTTTLPLFNYHRYLSFQRSSV